MPTGRPPAGIGALRLACQSHRLPAARGDGCERDLVACRRVAGRAPCTPERVLGAGEATLRSAGLSGAKAAALLDLANHELAGTLGLQRIGGLSDEAVLDRLVQVRGIGPWTAQMFLMFTLHRLDVWPVGDLGVRRGYSLAFGLTDMPAPAELEVAGERFRPYRSIAAWYCWRACEQV